MKIILAILVCCVIFGCENTCVKVGGGYTDPDGTKIEGDVEFCPSASSKEVGLPVFESEANGKAVLLTEKQVSKLLEKSDPEKKSINATSPMKRLSELVK